jgi:hypothetical protein
VRSAALRCAALRCAALRCAALSWAEAEVCAEERSERAGRAECIGWDAYIVLTAVGRYEPPMMHLSYASSPSSAALCHGAAGGACVFVARLHRPSRAIGFRTVGASSNASGPYACDGTNHRTVTLKPHCTAGTRPTRRSTSARCSTCRCGRSHRVTATAASRESRFAYCESILSHRCAHEWDPGAWPIGPVPW